MKPSFALFATVALLASASFAATSEAATIVNIANLNNDVAKAYYSSGAGFANGGNPLSVGNINHLPTRQVGAVKFNITQFADLSIESATLNLRVDYFVNNGNYVLPIVIGFAYLNYDKTSSVFVVGDLTTSDYTSFGTLNVSATGTVSLDVKSALEHALANEYTHLSLLIFNQTTIDAPTPPTAGQPSYVGFSTANDALYLDVKAIPEPSTVLLLGIAGGAMLILMRRDRLARNR